MKRVLLVTPPFTQLNTPYPATAFLSGFLKKRGIFCFQEDLGIQLFLAMFDKSKLIQVKDEIFTKKTKVDGILAHFIDCYTQYEATVDHVVQFLQGKNPSLALRIVGRQFLPEGPSFNVMNDWGAMGDGELYWAFGSLGIQDKAKFLASLYINDLCRVMQEGIDEQFALSKYGEKLAASFLSFDHLEQHLQNPLTLIGSTLQSLTHKALQRHQPDVLGITVPFPGNLLGALQIAMFAKVFNPEIKVIMGGGYPNTELRELCETRIFQFIDFITLDDGERPFERILEFLEHSQPERLVRTYLLEDDHVSYYNDRTVKDVDFEETGIPTYEGLNLDLYLSIFEMLNPTQRIWSDGRWNKVMLAHGCYWRQCSFCDVSLDYIERYQEASIEVIIQRIKLMINETGQTGFHFVDEAAPPKVLFALAKRLIEENLQITWWGNIRFEKSYTPKMTELLAASGCVAVTGGLEVASDRLLKKMKKGVNIKQAARVTDAFSQAGILVHTYLMYGFPSQTTQETIDALEVVRQLFLERCVQSAYWHRFAATVHSPVGQDPNSYGIKLIPIPKEAFARNEIAFIDTVKTDHDMLGSGLRKALYNYMLNIGLEEPLSFWFDEDVPPTSLKSNHIENLLS